MADIVDWKQFLRKVLDVCLRAPLKEGSGSQEISMQNHKDNTTMKKQNNSTIKAHFLRSGLYVLLIVGVCIIPFALAQSRSGVSKKTDVAARHVSHAVGRLSQTCLRI